MSNTVGITLADLRQLAVHAKLVGTQDAFIDVALQWATRASDEIERLRNPGYVRVPASEDEAALMTLLGVKYLQEHAPHRLSPGVRTA